MLYKIRFQLMALALSLVASGCAVTDFDRTADFKSYKSFSWGESELNVKNPVYNSALIEKNIRRTIEDEFSKRGISYKEVNSDVIVSYKTHTEEKQKVYGSPYGYSPYFRFGFFPHGFGWGYPYFYGRPQQIRTVTEGTLIIDITDRQTNEQVWRGSVEGDVDNVKNLQKQIVKGIKAILKKYPVRPDEPLRLPDADIVS